MSGVGLIFDYRGPLAGSVHTMPRFFGSSVAGVYQGGVIGMGGRRVPSWVLFACGCCWYEDTAGGAVADAARSAMCRRHRRKEGVT